jgi:hypothetical protein
MRLLLASFVMFSVLAWPSTEKNVQESHKDRNGNSAQGHAEVEPQKGPCVATSEGNPDAQDTRNYPQTKKENRIHTVKDHPDPLDWWYRTYVIVTIVGVIAALFGLGFIWKQNQTIKAQLAEMRVASRQTDKLVEATERNAEAARANADTAKAQIEAIVAEKRPWLLLEKVDPPYLVPAVAVPPKDQRFTHCFVFTKNYGKTPAKVTTGWARLQIGESPLNPPKDLVAEIGITEPIPEPYIFPPRETRPAEARLETGIISPQERDDVIGKNKTKYLWLLGFVKYQATLGLEPAAEYETRFCYVYETRTNAPEPYWFPSGPLEYNRAT